MISLGYRSEDKSPLDPPTDVLCAESIGGEDATLWDLKGYLFMSCLICKEVVV